MPSPTELAESLRNQVTELTRLGDFDANSSRHRKTVEDLYQLAAIVAQMHTQLDVTLRLLSREVSREDVKGEHK